MVFPPKSLHPGTHVAHIASLQAMCGNDCIACLCAYFIPPLGVYWDLGCGWEVIVCALLTLCGWLPGVLFAVCMIGCKEPSVGREICGEPTSVDEPVSKVDYIKV